MKEIASRPRRAFLILVMLACVGCDQASKSAAVRWLGSEEAVEIAGGMVRLDAVENSGGFLSVGAGLPAIARWWILTVGVGAALAAGVVLALRAAPSTRRRAMLAYALLLGGGAGNWLDRLASDGRVRDFVQLRIGIFRTGVFNLADVAILAGGFLVVLGALRRGTPSGCDNQGFP